MADNKFYDSTDFNWSAYITARPKYPPSLYDTVFDYHQKYSDNWDHAYDMGTGVGIVAWELAPRFKNTTASDPSAYQVSVAQSRRRDIRFIQSKAEDFSQLEAGSIDLVTMAEAIHYTDYAGTVASAAYVLRPGGTFATWAYDIVPRIVGEPVPRQEEIQTDIYQLFDALISAVVDMVHTTSPGVKIWSDMIDLKFDRKDWEHVRRVHWKRHRKFGEYITELIDEAPVENAQRPWETVVEYEESCMIVRDADIEWIKVYMDSMYPGISMAKNCPNEFAELEKAMQGGRRLDLAFTISLVLATRQ